MPSFYILFLILSLVLTAKPTVVSSTAVSPPPHVFRNLARGSALKMIADLGGGLPFEVWKSSVVMEHINANKSSKQQQQQQKPPSNDFLILQRILNSDRGIAALWSGCSARMVEGFFSGAVLLTAKEALRKSFAKPIPFVFGGTKTLPPNIAGFLSGAGGGAAQAIIMAPCSLLVTATAANGGSVWDAAKDVWCNHGLRGVYRGSSAVAARQATNWASRQGFTELIRPRIGISGIGGEILAGCLGGTLSAWNTPFEVARIESQSNSFSKHSSDEDGSNDEGLFGTMSGIVERRGIGGLYTGLIPRIGQACYQTVFLVTIPRILDAS